MPMTPTCGPMRKPQLCVAVIVGHEYIAERKLGEKPAHAASRAAVQAGLHPHGKALLLRVGAIDGASAQWFAFDGATRFERRKP